MPIDSYETPAAERLLLLGRSRHSEGGQAHRLLITEASAAATFLAGAGLLAGLSSSARPFSPSALAVAVAAYLVAGRVQYPVGSAWTAPTQLVFVPMLFVLPTPFVPLIVAACTLANRLPEAFWRGGAPTRLLACLGDSFYALGPALLLVLFHAQRFSWNRWPILLLAFIAQAGFDATAGIGRTWFAERVPPSGQLPMLWLYLTDACLSCVGLLIAASAAERPGLVLLALPLVGLQWLLARERRQRLDYSLALTAEHRVAVELQRGLLPKRLPDLSGIDIAAHYEAAGEGAEAGGDWYDAFVLPHRRIGVVVGDVTGRGLPAASTMGQLRSVTRAFALDDDGSSTPGEVLTRVNRYQRAVPEHTLFSVIYAVVDPHRGRLCWATAGHPPPLLRTASGDIRILRGAGPLIGLADGVYEATEQAVHPGETLILYSDGLIERRGESLDVGLQRLSAAVACGPDQPSPLCDHLLARMLSQAEGLRDDVTAVLVKIQSGVLAPLGTGGRGHTDARRVT
jgi:serine phosphatase RsbU (regulator of sigma subunit)